METLTRIAIVVAVLFIAVIAGTVIGGIVGWVVGAVFPFVPNTINQLAGTELTAFEVGAVLGFVGAFFRSSSTQ
jgi:hypothetical protein